uniref:Uncharacterized protein n=1 Tax=Oryza barthii TaxID=65489 RepID=A0A0D3HNQ3_9ORYZ
MIRLPPSSPENRRPARSTAGWSWSSPITRAPAPTIGTRHGGRRGETEQQQQKIFRENFIHGHFLQRENSDFVPVPYHVYLIISTIFYTTVTVFLHPV